MEMIKLLLGGSPCTKWSIAQTKDRETEPEGIGWEGRPCHYAGVGPRQLRAAGLGSVRANGWYILQKPETAEGAQADQPPGAV